MISFCSQNSKKKHFTEKFLCLFLNFSLIKAREVMENEKFDLILVTERFKKAIEVEEDVLMDSYLLAFREILK